MNKIIGIYAMITQLANINSDKLKMIDEEFGTVNKRLEKLTNNLNK